MSKYVDRIMDEVYDNFLNHFPDREDKVDFLEELIDTLKGRLENLNEDDNDDPWSPNCFEEPCDCEPEVCI